ncbi:MAG: FHA domain-containing protein [Planctomycetes bacterium]|nr:FHA domain-containing protein [Planctomycetota bacterium]
MSPPNNPIRLDSSDLYSPAVESYLDMQRAVRRDVGELDPQPLVIRVIYSSWFYLSIASAAGAVVAWAIMEPYYDDFEIPVGGMALVEFLLFPAVTGFIGLFLGAAEGIMCRNPGRAFICGVVGLGVGFAGGVLVEKPAQVIFTIMGVTAESFNEGGAEITGFALLILMMGRGAAWALSSLPAGLGQGIALKEKKVIMNGLVGGGLGGLLGGLLFDPIALIFTADDGQGDLSRCIGFACIGLLVGLFVGLVEGWTKTAWLMMRAGPLAGKQFVMFRDVTVLGSSPKADVYLFKDEDIEPQHARIHNRGGRFEIEDCDTPDGTYVNGIPVTRQLLNAGDQIVLGKTVLEFSIKSRD